MAKDMFSPNKKEKFRNPFGNESQELSIIECNNNNICFVLSQKQTSVLQYSLPPRTTMFSP
jgi:hypothetical protein